MRPGAQAREVVVRARYPHQQELVRQVAGADARASNVEVHRDGLGSAFDLVVETVGGASGPSWKPPSGATRRARRDPRLFDPSRPSFPSTHW